MNNLETLNKRNQNTRKNVNRKIKINPLALNSISQWRS
jgi:hypothetical protein